MSASDLDNDGIPNYLDLTPNGDQGVTYGGAGADQFQPEADEGEDRLVRVAGNVDPLSGSNAKDWYEAQFVQGTPYADELRSILTPLGYENDTQMLAALSRGVDFATNPYAQADADGNGDPFQWILSQPVESSGGSGSGGGPFMNTQTARDISSADEGMTVASAAYESQMGRRATMEEGEAFTDALNMMERQNPTKSVQKGTTSGRNTTSTSTTTGGFSAARFAEDWVRSQEGYGENFAATTFMGLLDEAISQPDVVKQKMEAIG